jgi:hypothetical protein
MPTDAKYSGKETNEALVGSLRETIVRLEQNLWGAVPIAMPTIKITRDDRGSTVANDGGLTAIRFMKSPAKNPGIPRRAVLTHRQ